MSSDFVRYSAEIETIDPNIEQQHGPNHRILGEEGP